MRATLEGARKRKKLRRPLQQEVGGGTNLNVVDVQPCRRELEPLTLEDALTFSVEVDLLLPALHLPLEALNVGDEVDGLGGRRSLNGLLLHVTAGLGNLSQI